LFATKVEKGRVGAKGLASPFEILHSRQKRPLFQDDSLRRGEFPPRQANDGLVGDPGFTPRVFLGDRRHRA
jgi:hypothetical protein